MPNRFVKINQLKPFKRNVNLRAVVLDVGETREGVSKKTGNPYKMTEVLLGDESAVVKAIVWGDTIEEIQKGETYEIVGASTNVFRGTLQVNINDKTKVNKSDKPISPDSVNTKINMSKSRR